jgi:hypothetical protein
MSQAPPASPVTSGDADAPLPRSGRAPGAGTISSRLR